MKRIIDHYLLDWKASSSRKSLLLRGARQVGKTYAVRKLGTTFENFVEINFERTPEVYKVFKKNLDPNRIIIELISLIKKPIIPGKTLLFFDEIQLAPEVITALRYFYEEIPMLHVIAAGSLLDFTIKRTGMPVGRVEFLYMYPLSFVEFLAANGDVFLAQYIINHRPEEAINEALHNKSLDLLSHYLALGGMPQSVNEWLIKQNPLEIQRVHHTILATYRQDFEDYSASWQIKYVELIYNQIPKQLGHKFKYSLVDGDYRKRELAPALDALVTANVAHKVYYASGSTPPLLIHEYGDDYKAIFLDIGLAHTALGLDNAGWFIDPQHEISVKGQLIEAFVGQELLVYNTPRRRGSLFYWHKETRTTSAEIDYLTEIKRQIIPIEVKAASGKTLRSLKHFLETRPTTPYGIRFSAQNYSVYENVHSYPLYAIAGIIGKDDVELQAAFSALLS